MNGKKRSRLCIEIGNSFFLDEFLKKTGFYPVIDAVGYGNPDTLRTIIFYYLLSQQANSHAADWHELNYTKNLFPNAAVSSQRISEALAEIGTEESKRAFFAAYYAFVRNRSRVREKVCKPGAVDLTAGSDGIDCGSDGILIDSTGLPNSAHMPITAISNHNGTVSEEIRLIYVVQQNKGFTKALKEHRWSLECRENFVTYNGRFYYIKRTEYRIGQNCDRRAHAYLGFDLTMRERQKRHLCEKMSDKHSNGHTDTPPGETC